MATKKRKVYFYRLNLIHQKDIDRNTIKEAPLTNLEIEKKFQNIYDKKTSILSSGRRAISVTTLSGDYVVEILSFSNHRALIKIGQQNPANTVALRDTSTLETEDVPMRKTQMLELFTFALIDFETCIVSYIGINGAPKISAIRNLFDNNLAAENTYATLAIILSQKALENLFKKKIISKVTLTIAVPEDMKIWIRHLLSLKLNVREMQALITTFVSLFRGTMATIYLHTSRRAKYSAMSVTGKASTLIL